MRLTNCLQKLESSPITSNNAVLETFDFLLVQDLTKWIDKSVFLALATPVKDKTLDKPIHKTNDKQMYLVYSLFHTDS